MVFPYYSRPKEEQQPEESQPPIPSYLYDVFTYMGEDLSSLYPPKPDPDTGYVAPGETHTLPSSPTTHPDPPIPNDVVAIVTPPPTISGPGYVMPGVALNPATETSPEDKSAAQAAEETSAQAAPPDIDELGDPFGTYYYDWIPGVSVDRQSAYSNLDVIRVKQDIETRPRVFQHCFQHSASRQDALECIYAFPPNFDESELRGLEQFSESTMSGGWGTTGGRKDSVTPDIDPGLLSTVYKIEEHLEVKYGYQIEWGEGIYNADRLEQLYELSQASEHIVDYLDIVYADDPSMTGIAAFRQHFSQNEHGQLEIQLGADAYFIENFENIPEEDAAYYGFVPLGDWRSPEQLRSMYLGSAVDIPTIVHEFGHVIDRSRGITDHLTEGIGPDGESRIFIESRYYGETFGADHIEEFGNLGPAWYTFNLDTYVYREIIEGFVAKQYFVQELWADLFMTAVLDPAVSGEEFEVESIEDIPAHVEIFRAFNDPRPQAPIFKCNVNAPCIGRTVEWENTPRAKAAQWYLPIVIRERFSTVGED